MPAIRPSTRETPMIGETSRIRAISNARCLPLRAIVALACMAALLAPAGAAARGSIASRRDQIASVRRAAGNFVTAELAANGASACAILNAPLRRARDGRTCAQRLSARFAAALQQPGARDRLRAQRRAVASAAVHVDGAHAVLVLATPLLDGPNRFVWSEDCWMLEG